jgi:hypothetical protein
MHSHIGNDALPTSWLDTGALEIVPMQAGHRREHRCTIFGALFSAQHGFAKVAVEKKEATA